MIRKLRCDNGREYANYDMEMFCRKKGITIEYTAPYCSQSNGKAERLNRTINDRARTVLVESGLSKNYGQKQ